MAATVELSTPPLMATAMGNSGMHRDPAQMRHAGSDGFDERVHLPGGIAAPQGEAHAGARAVVAQADSLQHVGRRERSAGDRKSTRLNSSHLGISYAVFCLKKK